MRYLKIVSFLIFMLSVNMVRAQELNCTVTIITNINTEVTTAEKELFEQLKQTIYDLMNNTKWTKDRFKVEERINCQMQLQINTINAGNFTGSLQVQATRPCFNSSYNSTLLNFQDDDFAFSYTKSSVVLFAPNQFRDNLSSILAFYAYFIIGLDYDSFSNKGGTPYFQEAQQIVSNAQSSGSAGWKSNEQGKRNRYWLVDNALQQLFDPLREGSYEYHRKGMDVMYSKPDDARKAMIAALQKISKISATRPNSINVLNFAQSKVTEIKSIFADATEAEKTEVVTVLKKIDPANSSKYDAILQ